MPRKKQQTATLAAVLIDRFGFRKACRVMGFIAAWGIVCESLGRPPETIDEYSDWWKQSRAKGFREQKEFRECIALETPTPLWEKYGYTGMFVNRNRGVTTFAVGNMAPL